MQLLNKAMFFYRQGHCNPSLVAEAYPSGDAFSRTPKCRQFLAEVVDTPLLCQGEQSQTKTNSASATLFNTSATHPRSSEPRQSFCMIPATCQTGKSMFLLSRIQQVPQVAPKTVAIPQTWFI